MSDERERAGARQRPKTRSIKDGVARADAERSGSEAAVDVSSMPFFQPKSLVGEQIDNWRLEALLGEGGMSAVYLAKHMWLDQQAALKVLLPEYCRDVDVLTRFQQEALAVSRLEHPNIIEVTATSPMGEALMKARVGETVRVNAPRGIKRFQILEII